MRGQCNAVGRSAYTGRLLAGTACPPDKRKTAEFKRMPRETRPIRLSHHTHSYLEQYRGIDRIQKDITTPTAPAVVTDGRTAQQIIMSYLRQAKRAVDKTTLAALVPGRSLRMILYHLSRRGLVLGNAKEGYISVT